MPLSGGVVLSLADMNTVTSISPGRVVCEPGAILADIDRATRVHSAQELRLHPSTYNTASIGGFIAGGSGGVGSINFGGLRDFGNVLRLRVVTMEDEPKVLELTGEDLHKVTHAYGTNGIITEVEMPLTASYDWVDVIAGFDDFAEAARFANALACQDGLLTKLITPIAAPAPWLYFKRHQKFLREGQSVVVIMVAPHSLDAFRAFTRREKAEIVFDSSQVEETKGLPPAYELSWNHTTLRALRVDPSITYLQSLYPFPNQLELVRKVDGMFPGEVMSHLEFVRFDGNITCFGLPLVKFTSEERLDEIIRLYEENGCPIFNPHRYTLEEGGMKQTDDVQLAFKREADPRGLLNPGKMIAWENPEYDYRSGRTYLFKGLER
jgi:FAD/FMN-containing dehydrogenase